MVHGKWEALEIALVLLTSLQAAEVLEDKTIGRYTLQGLGVLEL